MKAADDSGIERKASLYCNFHYISGKQGRFKKAGLGRFIRTKNASSEKGKFIFRAYVMVKSAAYLPVQLSTALTSHLLSQLNNEDFVEMLGLSEHSALTSELEALAKDLRLNGTIISWFNQLTEAGIWLDMTSNSVERSNQSVKNYLGNYCRTKHQVSRTKIIKSWVMA